VSLLVFVLFLSLTVTARGGPQLPARPSFDPIQPDLFSLGGAFANAWADFDRDGDPDLFVGFGGSPNRLYRNDGGTFRDIGVEAGVADARPTRAAAWGDYDADGDPDLVVGFTPGEAPLLKLYRNDRGRFVDATSSGARLAVATGAVRQMSWVDLDADGDHDLFVAFRDRANMLLRNAGGVLTDIAADIGLADARRTVGAVWFDMDDDHDLDLAVANMDGDANGLFRNDGGKFTDVAAAAGIAWGGRAPKDPANGTVRVCAADVDLDGRLDLFFANYGPNGLFLNRGRGTFEDASTAWGVAIDGRYDTCAFADIDHDGRMDVYVNGTYTANRQFPDYLLRNTGKAFEDVTPENVKALNASHGAAWADADGDGDLDLALAGARPDGMHSLLRNLLPPAPRRAVVVQPSRILPGAVVRAYLPGTPRRLIASALVDSGSGYDAQNLLPVHLGVGDAAVVDIELTYPAAGRAVRAVLSRVPAQSNKVVVLPVR
jgi:hypothetical protein